MSDTEEHRGARRPGWEARPEIGRHQLARNGGYFQTRLPSPYSPGAFSSADYITQPFRDNRAIPENIDLVCGDPILELQATAMSTLANNRLPTVDTWIGVVGWLADFLDQVREDYDVVVIDANPSFSLYTQIALSSVDRLILPVMADDSSRRAIQNAFSLIYGIRLPSPIYADYAFASKLREADRALPQVHAIAKNRLTQYMGPSTAYDAVLKTINRDIATLMKSQAEIFTFDTTAAGMVEIRDFQTTGVVAFARGCPFYQVRPGKLDVAGQRIQVNADQLEKAIEAVDGLVQRLVVP